MRYPLEGSNGFEMTIKEENVDYFANYENEEEYENDIIHETEIKEEHFDVEPVHEKKKRFKCTECNKFFGYRNVLNNHIKSIHVKSKPYKCDICNGQFKLEHNLKAHIKSVHEGKKTNRQISQKISNDLKKVSESEEQKVDNLQKLQKLQCNECGRSCLDEIEFGNHKLYHKSLEIVSCVKCHENIMRKSVKLHLKNVHDMEIDPEATWVQGNVEEFQCEDCGKQCENQNYYQDHDCEHQIILNNPQITAKTEIFDETKKESVIGINEKDALEIGEGNEFGIQYQPDQNEITEMEKEFQCDYCHKQCKSKQQYINHKHYCKMEQVTCKICNKTMKKGFLKQHNRRKHMNTQMTEENTDYFVNSQNEDGYESTIPEIKEEDFDVETVHEKKKRFKCTECNACFGYKQVLANHIKSKHEERRPYKCDICNGQFKLEHNLKSHIKSVHEGKNHNNTDTTDKIEILDDTKKETEYINYEKDSLEIGIQNQPNESEIQEMEEEFQCDNCDKKYESKRQYINHKQYCKMEQVICEICSKSVKRCLLKQHKQRKHSDKNDKRFKCDECPYATHRQELLFAHICNVKKRHKMQMNGVSDKEKHFQCEHCGKEFQTKKSYLAHRRYYNNAGKCEPNAEKSITMMETEVSKYDPGICPHCGNHFLRLKQHIIYKHTTEKPFKCEKCDFAHALPKGLRSHMNTVHPDKKALKMCHICSYKCILSSSLRIHIESVHDKIKNIDCPQDGCDVKFYAKSAMKLHFQREHSNDPNPFKCELCEKSFSNNFKLKRHKERVHEGIKLPCELCGKVYSCHKALKNHKKSVHGLYKKTKLKFDDV